MTRDELRALIRKQAAAIRALDRKESPHNVRRYRAAVAAIVKARPVDPAGLALHLRWMIRNGVLDERALIHIAAQLERLAAAGAAHHEGRAPARPRGVEAADVFAGEIGMIEYAAWVTVQ
jgi:hypothetical protein